MKHILTKLSKTILSSAENELKFRKYHELQKYEGWKIHVEYLLYIRGLIAEDMLGEAFTKLCPVDKDIQQRAYAMTDELILFLIDPIAKAQKLQEIKRHNAAMGATVRGATTLQQGATK